MCEQYGAEISGQYVRDKQRGRVDDLDRFKKLSLYADKRWEATRTVAAADRWLKARIAIERRWWRAHSYTPSSPDHVRRN